MTRRAPLPCDERLTGAALDRVMGIVDHRAGGRCERCGRGLFVAEHHHRKLRSRGGGDTAANLVAICTRCHVWVHANPVKATETGWMVPRTDDPATVRLDGPRYGDVYLDEDGQTYGRIPDACARATRAARLAAGGWPRTDTYEGASA